MQDPKKPLPVDQAVNRLLVAQLENVAKRRREEAAELQLVASRIARRGQGRA